MATYLDLKQRIIAETRRDDLSDDLADQLALAISRAIEYYQGERFWFNYGSATTSASAATVAMPATMRVIDHVRLSAGELLVKAQLSELLASTSSSGTPTHYAEFGDGIYLYPTPSSSITLTLYGTKYTTPPAVDADSTVWTNAAYDLIAAHTRFLLYRDVFRNPEAAEMAKGAVSEAFDRLKEETERRNDTPLRMPSHFPTGSYYAYI